MKTKSDNTKGNPYHDEEGKFTNAEGQGTASSDLENNLDNSVGENSEIENSESLNAIKIKKEQHKRIEEMLARKEAEKRKKQEKAQSILELEKQINDFLGVENIVQYDESTNLYLAQQYNNALIAVENTFPGVLSNGLLGGFGTRWDYETNDEKIKNRVSNIIKSEPFISRISEFGYVSEESINGLINELSNSYKTIMKFKKEAFNDPRKWISTYGYNGSIWAFKSGRRVISESGEPIGDEEEPIYESMIDNLGSVIALNKEWNVSSGEVNGNYGIDVAFGYHFSDGGNGGAFAIAAHELGHHVDHILNNFVTREEKEEIQALRDSFLKNVPKLKENGQISGYAADKGGNFAELVAESISDVICNKEKATDYSKKVFGLYKKIYDRAFKKQ